MTAGQIAALIASSAGAGVMNAMAGGGAILTYPTPLFLRESPVTPNPTPTVRLPPPPRGRRRPRRRAGPLWLPPRGRRESRVAEDALSAEPARRFSRCGPPSEDSGAVVPETRAVPDPLRDDPLHAPGRGRAVGALR